MHWRTGKTRYARWRQLGLSHDLAARTAGHQWGSWRLFPSKSSETRRTQDNDDVRKVLLTFAPAAPFCHRSNRIYPWRVKAVTEAVGFVVKLSPSEQARLIKRARSDRAPNVNSGSGGKTRELHIFQGQVLALLNRTAGPGIPP